MRCACCNRLRLRRDNRDNQRARRRHSRTGRLNVLMAWNISAGAIRNPIPPILLIFALLFAGWTAYGRLPINQLPNVDFGGFTVTVAQPGAAPAEMETQITQRIESALTAVEGVKRVTSTISPGVSQTMVEMEERRRSRARRR
jgi:multidrug efflux pump subunit AcrB